MVLRLNIDIYAVTWANYRETVANVAQDHSILVGISVVIFMGSAISNWRSQRTTRQRRKTWHWWHSQQQQQQHTQAEIVRDGLLQEAFALRRHLEKGSHPTQETVPYLEQFNQFYRSLENLSNELSPPFIDDSLPLALQFVLKNHKQIETSLDLELETDWSCDGTESNRTLLSIVNELLPLLLPEAQIPELQIPLNVRLQRVGTMNNLQLSRSMLNQQSKLLLLNSTELQYLKEIFHSLMSGTLDINQDDVELICQLSWPVVSG
ncbi:MAG: hypothetical protein KTR27_13800 [Leptolyngbyaceae cyanobacterium MAG.088]|nr:hypothetical protein [Leptolyngbyaceae cyanobacterium MAG.088]